MSINQRFKKLQEALGLSEYAFAKRLGYEKSSAINAITGKRQTKPGYELMKNVVETFHVNSDWLFFGTGAMFKSDQIEKDYTPNNLKQLLNVNIVYVHLVNKYAYAGYLSGFGDTEYIESLPKVAFPIADIQPKGDYLAFEVRGDSMYNTTNESYLEGDIILCRQIAKHHWKNKLHLNNWDFVIIHRNEGILLKRIIYHDTDKGVITLHSLNPYYENFDINLNDVDQIFNVIKVCRNVKR